MTQTTIGMPQTDASGLSENWLFRYCGDQHWQRLCAAWRVTADQLRDDEGHQIYPVFVAVRSRYSAPLNAVRLNQRFRTAVRLAHFGRTLCHSRLTYMNCAVRIRVEMLTTFAYKEIESRNGMRRTSPSSGLHLHGSSSANSPDVLKIGEAIRRGDLDGYQIDGETVSEGSRVSLSSEPFEPSPYMDFNGAGLLYFASYPTIADTLERQIMCRQNPFGLSSDWALATSTVARDVFYHRNLAIGQCVLATIGHLTRHGDRILLHTRLTCAESTDMLADVFTVKRVGAHRGEFHG